MAKGQPPTINILTSYYPYARGEEFLPAEFPYLLDLFHKIVLLPTKSTDRQRSDPRSIPESVELGTAFLEQLNRIRGRSQFARFLRALRSPAFRQYLGPEIGASLEFGLAGLRALVVRHVKADEILSALAQTDNLGRRNALLYAYWLDESALALARAKRVHPQQICVSRTHGFDLYAHRQSPPYQPSQERMIRSLDRVYTISNHGSEYLRSQHGGAQESVHVARLGVPLPSFRAVASQDGVFRLVSCSSVSKLKRLGLVLEALPAAGLGIEWTHIGTGPQLELLRQSSRRLPDHISVRWLGQIPHSEVMEFYRSTPIDAFINVSSSEGIPVSAMEALSFGIPVIATDVGGTAELVNRECGLLLPADPSIQQVSSAIRQIADQAADGRASMRQAAVGTVRSKFDVDKQHRAFAESLRQCLGTAK